MNPIIFLNVFPSFFQRTLIECNFLFLILVSTKSQFKEKIVLIRVDSAIILEWMHFRPVISTHWHSNVRNSRAFKQKSILIHFPFPKYSVFSILYQTRHSGNTFSISYNVQLESLFTLLN